MNLLIGIAGVIVGIIAMFVYGNSVNTKVNEIKAYIEEKEDLVKEAFLELEGEAYKAYDDLGDKGKEIVNQVKKLGDMIYSDTFKG